MKVSQTLTITAGTPLNVLTGLSAAAMASAGWTSSLAPVGSTFFVASQRAKRIFVQMLTGGSGVGYVLLGSPGVAPSHTVSGQLLSQLQAATAAAPGGNYTDGVADEESIDLSAIWIDGAHTGDTVLVTYEI